MRYENVEEICEVGWVMVERIPDPVIPGKLIVGPNDVALEELSKVGITVIVDLNQDDNERKEAGMLNIRYYEDQKIRVPDNFQPIAVDKLQSVVEVVSDLIKKGEYLYLHCTGGMGRSPTVTAAYLISTGFCLVEAICSVKKARPEAWGGANVKFAGNLCKFEEECRRDRRTTSIVQLSSSVEHEVGRSFEK